LLPFILLISNVKERLVPLVTLYIVAVSPDDCQNYRPKHVYVRNKRLLQHVWCCIGRITTEDINKSYPTLSEC